MVTKWCQGLFSFEQKPSEKMFLLFHAAHYFGNGFEMVDVDFKALLIFPSF